MGAVCIVDGDVLTSYRPICRCFGSFRAVNLGQGCGFWYHLLFADHILPQFSNWYQHVQVLRVFAVFSKFCGNFKNVVKTRNFQFLRISKFRFFSTWRISIWNSQNMNFAFFNLSFFFKKDDSGGQRSDDIFLTDNKFSYFSRIQFICLLFEWIFKLKMPEIQKKNKSNNNRRRCPIKWDGKCDWQGWSETSWFWKFWPNLSKFG